MAEVKEGDFMSANETNYAAELAAKVEELNKINDFYTLSLENFTRLGTAYNVFKKIITENDGEIVSIIMDPELNYAEITAETQEFEIYSKTMKDFCSMLSCIDNIEFSNIEEETLRICITLSKLWEAVKVSE